ncbi:YidH family protein [Curvibacter delicatus]|jgi:putative membrane protein|uniref:YidH family protein n=1 Tax=Curvibacter delicatus TaxID=80879 RepID=UPI00082D94E2|nr:DUF202 domain-containing protein [Curvibacter delicatus]
MNWQDQGSDPDYRFSLANERTFLAWIRTALAILAGAIVLHQVGLSISPAWFVPALSGALAFFGAGLGLGAYVRWRDNEIAMRHARPLPRSWLLPVLAVAAGLLGTTSAAVAFFA